MAIVLSDSDVRAVLSMREAVSSLEDAHMQLARGSAYTAERTVLKFPRGWLRVLPAALTESSVIGYKEFHLIAVPGREKTEAAVRYSVHLFDYTSGEFLALVDADYLTQVRTGATAALAAKYMAPEQATRVGIIGSGMEARSQLAAMAVVRDINSAKVFSRDASRRERFAREMSESLGFLVMPAETPQAAIEDAQILIVATNTAGDGTALQGDWLHSGMHVSSIGSTSPTQFEIDPSVWAQADRIVLDTRRALHESGDCIAAADAKVLESGDVLELHQVIGASMERARNERTLFKSVGSGLQDVAVAHRVYQLAASKGMGVSLAEYQIPKITVPN